MWDPRTYEDTDYGLDEGESFEPDLDPEEPFDRSMPHIMTVLGPIEPEELGVCIPATRFMPRALPEPADRSRARALAEATEELEAFASVGGRSIVDIATATTGRDLPALQRLTQLVPSHLIAATGLPDDDDEASRNLEHELAHGLEGTGVRPGLLALAMDDRATDRLNHACSLSIRYGMPLLVEIAAWEDAEAVTAAWRQAIASLDAAHPPRLILAGPAGPPDVETVAEANRAGAFVTVRTPGPGHPQTETALARHLVELAHEGFDQSVLVTMDLVMPRVPVAAPAEPRSPYLIDRFALALMEAGASALGVRRIMIENPARALTILPPVS